MKKIIFILILITSLTPSFAEIAKTNKKDNGIRIDGGIALSGSIHSSFFTINPEVLYDFGFLAVGVGVNTMFGLTFSDIYIAPYAELELGWFYLAGGAIFELKTPVPDSEKAPAGFIKSEDGSEISPYIVIGANAAIIPLETGAIGIDINLGFIPTATPIQVVDNSDNFLANLIGSIFISLISASFDSIKAGGSIYYTVTF